MAAWRYLLFDIPSLQPVAELPVASRSFGEAHNAPGAFTAVVPFDDMPTGVTIDNLVAPDAAFVVERDDVLLWAGPILATPPNFKERTLTLAGEGWHTLMRRRRQSFDHEFVSVDQVDIAASFIDNVQAIEYHNGYVGIDTSLVQISGVLRSQFQYGHELTPVGTLIENLANRDNGFYFRYEPRWTNGPNSELTIKFLCQYPPSGRVTELVLHAGENCTVGEADLEGGDIVNRVWAVGEGQGDSQPRKLVANNDHVNAHYMLEDVVQAQNVSDEATLRDHAVRRLRVGSRWQFFPKVRVDTGWLGEFLVGDRVRFILDDGPFTIDEQYRIVGYDCPDEEWLDLELAPLALFEGGSFT